MTTKFDVNDTIKFEVTGRITSYFEDGNSKEYGIQLDPNVEGDLSNTRSSYRSCLTLTIDANNPILLNAIKVDPSEISRLEAEAASKGYRLIKSPRYQNGIYRNGYNNHARYDLNEEDC